MVAVRLARRRTRRLVSVALAFTALGLSSCGDNEPGTGVAVVAGLGDAYVAVLDTVLPELPTVDDGVPVVYVWEFTETPMSLDDQVAVIDHFDGTHDVRFVDTFDAAVDPELPEIPPRDNGLLVGLGPLTVDEPYIVRVELYEAANVTTALLVTLVVVDDVWTVTAEEPVEPEAFDAVA